MEATERGSLFAIIASLVMQWVRRVVCFERVQDNNNQWSSESDVFDKGVG